MSAGPFIAAACGVGLIAGMTIGAKTVEMSRPPTYEERWGDAYRFCLMRLDYPRVDERKLCVEAADRVLKCAEAKP